MKDIPLTDEGVKAYLDGRKVPEGLDVEPVLRHIERGELYLDERGGVCTVRGDRPTYNRHLPLRKIPLRGTAWLDANAVPGLMFEWRGKAYVFRKNEDIGCVPIEDSVFTPQWVRREAGWRCMQSSFAADNTPDLSDDTCRILYDPRKEAAK